ncbi:PCRF domain-containing protein [Actinomadura sp. KC06]|uniref:PCRF domain-containing protein n=1 Tax=Actinomadura sp. KC06 TaxID=2530369 RepID=UPI0010471CCD|nr:PCRF domain-containing protein [Actinomadura sp. KC06]TDD25867.1 PCRF domain-containing protein [Actinomadura sp. KC06]
MGVDGLEAIAAEYAALEERLADPSVHRDFRSVRRLRRCLEALEPLHSDAARLRGLQDDLRDARDLAHAGGPAGDPVGDPASDAVGDPAGDREWTAEAERLAQQEASLRADIAARLAARDRYDPYDVIVLVERVSGDGGCVRALADVYRRRARDERLRVEDLLSEPPPGPGTHEPSEPSSRREPSLLREPFEAFAVIAGEIGPGAWAGWKHENGDHRVRLAAQPPSAELDGVVRVTVLPDAACSPDPGDLRIDLYCMRVPGAPTILRVVHQPTGIAAHGIDPSARRARDNALRVVSARLAAAQLDPGEPAARLLARAPGAVRERRLT